MRYVQRYSYAFNNPATLVDPSGLSPLGDVGQLLGEAAQALGDCALEAARINDADAGMCRHLLAWVFWLEGALMAGWEGAQITWDWFVDQVRDAWNDFVDDTSDPSVWKPLAGASIFFVADIPGVALDIACVASIATTGPGGTGVCYAAEVYFFAVMLPATDLGVCMIRGEEGLIVKSDEICSHD